jgi:hypothetical protein
MVKDFKTPLLPGISFANVCTKKKKTRGLYHVLRGDIPISSRIYFKFLVILTALTVRSQEGADGRGKDHKNTPLAHNRPALGAWPCPCLQGRVQDQRVRRNLTSRLN